ncbi:MAG: histidine kinase [Marinoscillum sp.]
MNRWIEVIVNIAFWGITGWLITSSYSIVSLDHEIIDGVETIQVERDTALMYKIIWYLSIAAIMFYLNVVVIIQKADSGINPQLFLLIGSVLIVAILITQLSERMGFPVLLRTPATLSVGLIFFYFSTSIAYGAAKHSLKKEKQHQKLILDKKQAELNLLRNQLQPHFLFNALNNLLSLVDQKKSPVLAGSIDKLSSLLRYVIDEIQADKVEVQKEIDFIKQYADLQMLRYDKDEVDFDLTINGTAKNLLIEPGIFIPFIENAFKYGTKPEEHSKIKVVLIFSELGTLQFYIHNKVLVNNQLDRKGTGIAYTRERLQMVYPAKHKLMIDQTDHSFEVTLEIDTK